MYCIYICLHKTYILIVNPLIYSRLFLVNAKFNSIVSCEGSGRRREEGMYVGQVPLSLSLFKPLRKKLHVRCGQHFLLTKFSLFFSLIVLHTNGCMCFLHEIGFFRVYWLSSPRILYYWLHNLLLIPIDSQVFLLLEKKYCRQANALHSCYCLQQFFFTFLLFNHTDDD